MRTSLALIPRPRVFDEAPCGITLPLHPRGEVNEDRRADVDGMLEHHALPARRRIKPIDE